MLNNLGLTVLIIDLVIFFIICISMCNGSELTKNANSPINLIFVGAFHPKSCVYIANMN